MLVCREMYSAEKGSKWKQSHKPQMVKSLKVVVVGGGGCMNLWTHWKKSVLKLRLNIQSAVIPTDKLPKHYKHMKIDTTEKQSYRPGQSLIRIRCVRIAEPNSVFKETGSVTKTHARARKQRMDAQVFLIHFLLLCWVRIVTDLWSTYVCVHKE